MSESMPMIESLSSQTGVIVSVLSTARPINKYNRFGR